MRYAKGWTRRVFLVGDCAIKVTRVGVGNILYKLLLAITKPTEFRNKVSVKTNGNLRKTLVACVKLFFPGIGANRREYRLYQGHPEGPLAPVKGMYLGGLILVMERGEPVSEKDCVELFNQYPGADLRYSWQICAFRDGLRYVDYGHEDAQTALGL